MTTLKAGVRLGCPSCTTQVIVVGAPSVDVKLTCSGELLGDIGATGAGGGHDGDGAQLGKRYADEDLGLELLCTKAGSGTLAVDGRPLALKGVKQLPSSD
ncbi:MAG TPA: hypothetical protein VMU76_11945 [Acidimicrobiales bacterium]|nr:hypothetical protein [Acidimicrobiales bacterium]